MFDINDHPLPAFMVDEDLNILSQSKLATEAFSARSSFLELVDQDSRKKASKILNPLLKEAEVELVMGTAQSPYTLFQVYAKWSSNGSGQLICVRQDERLEKLSEALQKQQERLADTNFDLLDKKEELEAALVKVKKLSSPFLPISSSLGIIPLFGELDENLFHVNAHHLLQTLQDGNYDRVILDFSGVGEVQPSGVVGLLSFCSMLDVVGVSPVLCGIKPIHAQHLAKHDFELNQHFDVTGNLKNAVTYYLTDSSI
ncbi:STAS domain-containing protein [Bacillus sp. RAR_GA_16]|uniref:STAS domain-containing protein n=1 Tax=Bacillus sp. RAR_GA_16 TaxID=2876774 RepID=UPI001CCCA06B|nr:STAS domain-containing protein [Bacillus sp. RAR_GA_16]MCA0173762.1 STAS domain-containing protein [Bacillus sp. RAR_GA_16]